MNTTKENLDTTPVFHNCGCGHVMPDSRDAEYVGDWEFERSGKSLHMYNCPHCGTSFTKAEEPKENL